MRSRLHFIWLLALLPGGSGLSAQETNYKAYTLFIYNFMKYIEWPDQAGRGDFVIAVVGDSPIHRELQQLAEQKKLKGRVITLRKVATAEEASNSHLVFVPDSRSGVVKALKEQTRGKPVLIVGEREGLARKGASISFVTLEEDQLKFDINKKDIEQHNLKVANQLVSLGIPIN